MIQTHPNDNDCQGPRLAIIMDKGKIVEVIHNVKNLSIQIHSIDSSGYQGTPGRPVFEYAVEACKQLYKENNV